MNTQRKRRSVSNLLLTACLFVLALGALPAGWLLFTQPDGSGLSMPLSLLAGSPFPDYTVPGLVLFMLFGVGSLVVLYGLIAQPRWAWTEPLTHPLHTHWSLLAAMLIGIGLMIWIVVQVVVIRTISFLQPTMFLMGLAILLLAIRATSQPQAVLATRQSN